MVIPERTFDIIGFLGAALILTGFYRISLGRWSSKSFLYELDNLLGASLLIIYELHNHVYIVMVLNIIWAIVAFRGISSFVERYNGRRTKSKRLK